MTMRNLFRQTSFLFWQYPILWLPIVIVDPIVFCLNLFDHKVTHAIILSVVTKHSVLGGASEPIIPTSFQTLKILFLTKPIDWGTHLVALYLYICAMMTILALTSALRSKQKLSPSRVLLPFQQSFPNVVFFSLKLLVAVGIAAIPFFIFTFVFFERNGARYVSVQNFSLVFSTLALSALAYFVAPAAVKLLRPHDSKMITPEKARQAGISAALAVIACDALYFFTMQIRPTFISRSTHWSGDFIYGAVASLVSAMPYTVLFIALSLLAKDDEPDTMLDAEPQLS